MRTFGANRAFLRKTQWIEFGVLGLISGLLAVIITEAIIYALYTRVMAIEYHPNLTISLIVPFISALFVSLVGLLGVKQVLNRPPVHVLREL